MERRDFLAGGVALAAVAMAQAASAAEDMPNHEHHHHDHAMGPKFAKLATTAADCLQTGQVCIDHCLILLSDGDKAMAACAQSVTQMLAICSTLQRLANAESKYLPQMAKLALDVCRDCAEQCKKHADKHQQCKDCMNSCLACADECKKVAA